MRLILMTDEKFPINIVQEDEDGITKTVFQQSYNSLEGQDALEELCQRCILIGCVLGIVFDGYKF